MKGDVYGLWTILDEPVRIVGTKRYQCLVRCQCGTEKVSDWFNIKYGCSKSCGCLRVIASRSKARHGDCRVGKQAKLHRIWTSMLARCRNENTVSYQDYGGRGITVCSEWLIYERFKEWAIANGYQDGLTIERKEVNGHYEPGNVTWIPRDHQARNRRNSPLMTAFGEVKRFGEWQHDSRCVVTPKQLRQRVNLGWELEPAMTTPMRVGRYTRKE